MVADQEPEALMVNRSLAEAVERAHEHCVGRADLLAVRGERDEARAAVRRAHDAIKAGAVTAGAVALALFSRGDGEAPSMLDELGRLRAVRAAMGPVVDAAIAYVQADPDGQFGVPWPELEAAVAAYVAADAEPYGGTA